MNMPVDTAEYTTPQELVAGNAATRAMRVRAEQIRTVYQHSPTTTIGSLAAGALLVWLMWGYVATPILLGWFAVLCAHQMVRIYHFVTWKRSAPTHEQMDAWGRRYWFATASAGLIWGASGWLLYVPDSTSHEALLALLLMGMAAVSTGGLSAYWPGFITLVPLMLTPFIVRVLVESGTSAPWLSLPTAIALGVALSFGRTVNRAIAESFEKRFENADLVEALRRQKSIADAARVQAETANRAKTQFFAAASHDLRQPLHALGLFASALSEKIKEPDVLHVVHSINASVGALEGLFNELLDISKIDAGAIKAQPQVFALGRLFERLRMDFEPEAFERGLKLSIRPCALWVDSDPLLVERILRNLLTNAMRYTQSGGVLLAARRRGEHLSVEVWDTGIGIPPEQQERIFEEFIQLANPERSSKKGLGLGLSIVRRLCNLLDVKLSLLSRPARGSVFRFELPLAEAPRVDTRPAKAPERTPGSLNGILIAVVDDEDAIVEGMRVLLTGWGAEVIGASSGHDVMDLLEADQRTPDLAIVDFRLQNNFTGVDVIAQLRQRYGEELPAILVTGSTAPEHIEEAKVHDLHLLLKPVMPAKLRTLINFKLQQRLSVTPR